MKQEVGVVVVGIFLAIIAKEEVKAFRVGDISSRRIVCRAWENSMEEEHHK